MIVRVSVKSIFVVVAFNAAAVVAFADPSLTANDACFPDGFAISLSNVIVTVVPAVFVAADTNNAPSNAVGTFCVGIVTVSVDVIDTGVVRMAVTNATTDGISGAVSVEDILGVKFGPFDNPGVCTFIAIPILMLSPIRCHNIQWHSPATK